MGFKLRREVRDLLPPGLLTPTERAVVLEAADACNDDTREGWPGAAWLAVAADVPEGKVGELLNRVGKKWVELRVPLGVGKDGRAYYSHPKKRTTFRFPPADDLARAKAPQTGGPSKAPHSGGPKAPQIGGPKATQNGGPFPSVVPSIEPLTSLAEVEQQPPATEPATPDGRERRGRMTAQERADAEGWHQLTVLRTYGPDEARYLLDALNTRHGIYSAQWWRTANDNGTLDARIAEVIADYHAEREAEPDQPAAA